LLRILLQHGADVRRDGGWALVRAVQYHNCAAAASLLSAGAGPNGRDRYGASPLNMVQGKCAADLVKLLLAHGADPNEPDSSRRTPLLSAIIGETQIRNNRAVDVAQPMVVRMLLEHGADPNRPGWDLGRRVTPLVAARERQFATIARMLRLAGARR